MKLLLPLLLLACFLLVATARKSDLKQVDAAARAIGVDRKKFGTYIHATKDGADYIIKDELFVRIQCYTLDFFIRVCLCWEQWLAACVACEHVVITIQGAKFIQQKSKKLLEK